MIIKDGAGSGRSAKVNSENRILGSVISEDLRSHAAEIENAYNINTGTITLTSANVSAVAYVKNNETKNIIIDALIYNIGASTGGSGIWTINVIRNPTAGTIVSGASAVSINQNQNFTSNATLSVNAYKGAEGNTITDGSTIVSTITSSAGRIFLSLGALVLGPGNSIGVTIQPPASNTSNPIQVAFSTFLQTLEV